MRERPGENPRSDILPCRRERDLAAEGLMLLEGALLVERAALAGVALTDIYCVPRAAERARAWAGPETRLSVLAEAEISGIAGYPFHRGVLALGKRPRIEAFGVSPAKGPRAGGIVCLWGLSDPLNAGAIARSALAFGAAALGLGPGSADPFCARALRASMGATLALPVYSLPGDAEATLELFSRSGRLSLAAARCADSLTPAAFDSAPTMGKAWALFLGNEGEGLPEVLAAACDRRIWIPHETETDSLNVAAAAAILLWELSGRGA